MTNGLDEITVLKRIRLGDADAFKQVFDTYYVPLCRYVELSIQDGAVAEEIVQDLFVSIWERRELLEIHLTLKAYLFQSVKNRSANYFRDNRRIVFCDELPADLPYHDYEVELGELKNLLREAILSLPDKCSEIYKLSREKYLTNLEIAEQTGLSVRTVENHLARALSRIKKYLGPNYSYLW